MQAPWPRRSLSSRSRRTPALTAALRGEAVHRLSGLPAGNLRLRDRGLLKENMYADVVVFDPAAIADRATYKEPHQYAVGVKYVLVNGEEVLHEGEPTKARPGRALWGPGKKQ